MRRLLLLLLVVLVNLPAVHERWTNHEIASKGKDVTATVVDARAKGHLVDYRLPRDVDPKQTTFSAGLTAAAFDRARATKQLDVRVVPGKPGTNRPDGEASNPLFLVVAIAGDLIVLLVVALWWWRRRGVTGATKVYKP